MIAGSFDFRLTRFEGLTTFDGTRSRHRRRSAFSRRSLRRVRSRRQIGSSEARIRERDVRNDRRRLGLEQSRNSSRQTPGTNRSTASFRRMRFPDASARKTRRLFSNRAILARSSFPTLTSRTSFFAHEPCAASVDARCADERGRLNPSASRNYRQLVSTRKQRDSLRARFSPREMRPTSAAGPLMRTPLQAAEPYGTSYGGHCSFCSCAACLPRALMTGIREPTDRRLLLA